MYKDKPKVQAFNIYPKIFQTENIMTHLTQEKIWGLLIKRMNKKIHFYYETV